MHQTPKQEEWEKTAQDWFQEKMRDNNDTLLRTQWRHVKDMIRGLLAAQRKEIVEKLAGIRKPIERILGGDPVTAPRHDVTYNGAIEDAIRVVEGIDN